MKLLRTFLLPFAFIVCLPVVAQKDANFVRYIETYKQLAIDQMHENKIPASITLAQAILESGAGTSDLAVKGLNHFGIKCGNQWTGPYVCHDDDKKKEKFRKYDNVAQSYADHSKILKKERYRSLYDINPLDYKAWARGVKACGYATNPAYADRLIKLIEQYELNQWDEDWWGLKAKKKYVDIPEYTAPVRHAKQTVNGVQCVVAKKGDSWEQLAKETKIPVVQLLKFNEIDESFPLYEGMNVFLAKKATKAEAQYADFWHKVKAGESMYTIAQFYGIRVKSLYKMNFKDFDYVPSTGDLLKVR